MHIHRCVWNGLHNNELQFLNKRIVTSYVYSSISIYVTLMVVPLLHCGLLGCVAMLSCSWLLG